MLMFIDHFNEVYLNYSILIALSRETELIFFVFAVKLEDIV